MAIDFRPDELIVNCKEETKYSMSIRHRSTGIVVAGNGDHKYALECGLLEKLRQKIQEKENDATGTGG